MDTCGHVDLLDLQLFNDDVRWGTFLTPPPIKNTCRTSCFDRNQYDSSCMFHSYTQLWIPSCGEANDDGDDIAVPSPSINPRGRKLGSLEGSDDGAVIA